MMPFLKTTRECLWQPEIFDIIVDAFDEMTELKDMWNGDDFVNDVLTFRVSNDEIKNIEGQISPTIISFPGIKPFIIEWL